MKTVDELLDAFGGRPLESLTKDEAAQLLEAFLAGEASNFDLMDVPSLSLDYSPQSVTRLISWVVEHELQNDPQSTKIGVWSLRVGYYVGEALRAKSPSLYWSTADRRYAHGNHPVIAGFPNWPSGDSREMPVVVISGNLLFLAAKGATERVDTVLNSWFGEPLSAKG